MTLTTVLCNWHEYFPFCEKECVKGNHSNHKDHLLCQSWHEWPGGMIIYKVNLTSKKITTKVKKNRKDHFV